MNTNHKDIESTLILLDNKPVEVFEGIYKVEIRYLLHNPFSPDSPFKIKKNIPDKVLDKIPILRQIEFCIYQLDEIKKLKLTHKGSFPRSFVKEICNAGIIKAGLFTEDPKRNFNESSLFSVHLTRILLELSGITERKNKILSLTTEWKDYPIKKNRNKLLLNILPHFTQEINWAAFDYCSFPNICQEGFGFTLYLISKYGNSERPFTFYANKFFEAFPDSITELEEYNTLISPSTAFKICYSRRTFAIFLDYSNLINRRVELGKPVWIKKSKIFDKIISFQ